MTLVATPATLVGVERRPRHPPGPVLAGVATAQSVGIGSGVMAGPTAVG